jgi:hypothetical protein
MFGPFTAWLRMEISPAERWAEAGGSKRAPWINGSHGGKTLFLMREESKKRCKETGEMLPPYSIFFAELLRKRMSEWKTES